MSNSSPEQEAREEIDEMLRGADWEIQNYRDIDLSASKGVAVREFPVKSGDADYLLFVDEEAVGVIEAKKEEMTLSGVEEQSESYASGFPEAFSYAAIPLPFAYESTGTQTYFRDTRDEDPRPRRVFSFHQPETLERWLRKGSLVSRLRDMPSLQTEGLRDCQIEGIRGLEGSLRNGDQKALVQMATGSGKTYMAATEAYRLIKHAKADRILFLVDRKNLGDQTEKEFQQFSPPDDTRKLTELYNVQNLSSNAIDPVSKICVSTIQRMYSILKDEEIDEDAEEISLFEDDEDGDTTKNVSYNPDVSIETFDFIITDECHRSIYNKWRQVLEYFDARIIGLTATPSKETFGFFNQNLVTEYPYERAIADGVNVGYDVFRIRTRITEMGEEVEAGHIVDERDKRTRERQWKELDDSLDYTPSDLDSEVVAEDQIRTILRTYRDNLPQMFPEREQEDDTLKHAPKTVVFAKDDSHAEDITRIAREVFGKGNEFCKKITYKTTGKDPHDLISEFRNSYNPRIAVSVDMISTGTDIKPIECLLFMRNIKSRTYFEQMKGRGTRTIDLNDLQAVTPDAQGKDRFIIIDSVGVCEQEKTDSRSLNRSKSVDFEKLVEKVAEGERDEDTIETLASRLSRRQNRWSPGQIEDVEEVADEDFNEIINDLLDAADPDLHLQEARDRFDVEDPTAEQIEEVREEITEQSCALFEDEDFRERLLQVDNQQNQIIDTVNPDEVIEADFDKEAREQAEMVVDTFEEFIEENKDEITALEVMLNQPYGEEKLGYEEVQELAEAIERPPYNLTTDRLWNAYEQLEETSGEKARSERVLTDIISLVRYELEENDELEPFSERVDRRFKEWLDDQGRDKFSEEQLDWLRMIKNHIATSMEIEKEDLQRVPFNNRGGIVRASELFGNELDEMLNEMNEELTA
jgi:type I restriction enzyme R subunit